MTLAEEDRKTLIAYRTGQANEAKEEARFLIEHDRLKLAVNRIYYSMFYILSVLALKHKFKTSKHSELIGWFNKNFIKTGLIDREYGVILKNALNNRSESDYGIAVTFEKREVEEMFGLLEDFLTTIETFIQNMP